jgi:allophanate hydrolase
VTRAILEPGLRLTAVDAFRGFYRLEALRNDCLRAMAGVDVLCVPSIPCFVTLDEISADPIGPNARLGTYTNFVNLLDLCGIAVPTGDRSDGRPGSVTILARGGRDALAASVAAGLQAGRMGATSWTRPEQTALPQTALPDEIALAVCGAHMSGLPLNRELTSLGSRLIRTCRTAPQYRLHALAGGPPQRPGLVRDPSGAAITVEVWGLPRAAFGTFIAGVPSPLAIGTVVLEDGSAVKGFVCETAGLAGASDITALGSWRAFLQQAEAVA